jgi:hypothetical protein
MKRQSGGNEVTDLSTNMLMAEKTREKPPSLSVLLRQVSASSGASVTLGAIAEAMADRSFGAFLVVFCIPNLIPLPPGATFILGLPLVFISLQMAFSRHDTIWLPKRLRNFSFDNKAFSKVLDKIVPWLEMAERWIKPRLWMPNARLAERLFGVFALFLALIIFLPIPLGNMGPAYALCLMGLGFSERDGIALGLGVVIGVAFSFVVSFVGYEIVAHVIPAFFRHLPEYWHWLLSFLG